MLWWDGSQKKSVGWDQYRVILLMARIFSSKGANHLKKMKPTIYGHQKFISNGIRPHTKKNSCKIHDVDVAIFDPNKNDDMKNMIALDLPGKFLITSGSGNK